MVMVEDLFEGHFMILTQPDTDHKDLIIPWNRVAIPWQRSSKVLTSDMTGTVEKQQGISQRF